MTVANWISGIVGLVLLFLFLGKYAVSIGSIPLWIIIVVCLLMPVADFVLSVREGSGDEPGGGGNGSG